MTYKGSFDTPDAFLHMARDELLRDTPNSFGGEKIVETLENAGISNYGQLLDYAGRHDLSKLPGIGAHTAEELHRSIARLEQANKHALEAKLHKVQGALSQEANDSTKTR